MTDPAAIRRHARAWRDEADELRHLARYCATAHGRASLTEQAAAAERQADWWDAAADAAS